VERTVRVVVGVAIAAVAIYLVFSPVTVADALGKPHDLPTRMINLRASWGGTLLGLGAFVAWLPALRPYPRTAVGLLGWAMAGIGAARLVGFAIDGSPDTRQYIWIAAEIAITVACAIVVRRLSR
jgi:hypothetical protein